MKKIVPISLLALTLLSAVPVLALDSGDRTPTRNVTSTVKTVTPEKDEREEFRLKLATIKDEKKKAIVARIDQQIVRLNAARTAIMLKHLDTIQDVLTKLKAKTQDLAAAGKDVTTVNTALIKSQAAVDAARAAIIAQAAKTYTITITTDANLGSAVSTARLAFARDLKAAQQSLIAVRKATKDVLVALAKVVGEKLEDTSEK